MDTKVVKAVAIIASDGFLAKSAPIFKPRAKPTMILLSYDQRMILTRSKLASYEEMRYQGKFPGALPQGYNKPNYNARYSHGWINADNQWYNAPELADYLNMRVKNTEDDSTLTIGGDMVVKLVNQAAG